LLHDKFNILAFQASLVNLLIVVLFFFLGIAGVNGLALAVIVGCLSCFGIGELLSSSSLGLGVEVFDLSFTKDA